MKKILVDMDNTLFDFTGNFRKYAEKAGYLWIEKESYELSDCIDAKLETAKIVKEAIFQNEEFWQSIPLKPYAQGVFDELDNEFDVWIVTSPYLPFEKCIDIKKQAIRQCFPTFDPSKVIFTSEKWKVKGDCIIEDDPIQIRNFNGITICFDYPYNRDVSCNYRTSSWGAIRTLLLRDKVLEKQHDPKGVKFNYDKLKWSLVDFHSLNPMVEVLMHGAKKYSPDNWKNVPPEEYIDALLRHVTEYSDRLKNKEKLGDFLSDPDSKLPVIGHILCNAMFLSWFEREGLI